MFPRFSAVGLKSFQSVGRRHYSPLAAAAQSTTTSSSSSSSSSSRSKLLFSRTKSTATKSTTTAPYIGSESSTTHFGFEQVGVDQKEGRVREVFDSVADSYDVMNDLMSAGVHRMWKDYLLEASGVESMARAIRRRNDDGIMKDDDDADEDEQQQQQLRILDVAGGTGDIAFRLIEAADCVERSKSSGIDPISVTVCDINHEMLRVGERRARQHYGNAIIDETKALAFVHGDAQDLHDFDDNSFDLYTISFGLRNVTDVDLGLKEAFRVLRPGGRFMCLEFSQVPNPILRQLYEAYSFNVIPAIGQAVTNDRASYQYLVESIRRFSNQQDLLARMDRVGFQSTRYTNMSCGVVALHEGWKPL